MSDADYTLEDIQKHLAILLGDVSFVLDDHSSRHASHYTGANHGPTHICVRITSQNVMSHRDKIDQHRQIMAHLQCFLTRGLHSIEIRMG